MAHAERVVEVDTLRVRYLEAGQGAPVLLLHGASLGSSADVWAPTLGPLAARGLRVIAFDQPGFGLTDNPRDYSVGYRQAFILEFMDALGLARAHLVGHSQAGRMAVSLAFAHPARVGRVVVVATGSLLPPLRDGEKRPDAAEGDEGTAAEPSLEDARGLLEANLFHRRLITPEVLATRHRMSLGKNFEAFRERTRTGQRGGEKDAVPLWQRLDQVPAPLLLVYGKDDRGSAAARAALAKARDPGLDLHVLERCGHLVQWDAAEEFVALAGDFLAPR